MTESYILFDFPDSEEPTDRRFLESIGLEVEVCHGPRHGTLCPILAGATCPLAENAHGIVFGFDLDRPQHRAILKKYREILRDDLPIRVVVSRKQAVKYSELLRGLRTIDHRPATGDLDGLAAEIQAADSLT